MMTKNMKYNSNKVYIVFDGTSHYGVWGCDVEIELSSNDVEVVKGPYPDWNDIVEDEINKLNDESYGTKMYR